MIEDRQTELENEIEVLKKMMMNLIDRLSVLEGNFNEVVKSASKASDNLKPFIDLIPKIESSVDKRLMVLEWLLFHFHINNAREHGNPMIAKEVRNLANDLGIPYEILNLSSKYKEEIENQIKGLH
jgi:hypothetical protein